MISLAPSSTKAKEKIPLGGPKKKSPAEAQAEAQNHMSNTFMEFAKALAVAIQAPVVRGLSERAEAKAKLDKFVLSTDCTWTPQEKTVVYQWFKKDPNSASDVMGTLPTMMSSLLMYASTD